MKTLLAFLCAFVVVAPVRAADDVFDKVEHGYTDSNGVKIHYAPMGTGLVVVMMQAKKPAS
ncbi:MAG: hypothetical protein AUH72_01940 [Acidobacteria bacterium 13_1_40CM_4_65_8]|nr:MAG: hypothetical protein AUH72_01940 [Acidobacteria bacterium 13_1_40CM_4_65_8]